MSAKNQKSNQKMLSGCLCKCKQDRSRPIVCIFIGLSKILCVYVCERERGKRWGKDYFHFSDRLKKGHITKLLLVLALFQNSLATKKLFSITLDVIYQ